MVRIHPLIRELFKGDDNAAAVVKLKVKRNKRPFQGTLNSVVQKNKIQTNE